MVRDYAGWWTSGLEGIRFWPFLAPCLLFFYLRKMAELHIWSATGSFHFVSFAIMFVCYQNSITKNHPIWASGWSDVEMWLWKVGCTPLDNRQVRHHGPLSSWGATATQCILWAGCEGAPGLWACKEGLIRASVSPLINLYFLIIYDKKLTKKHRNHSDYVTDRIFSFLHAARQKALKEAQKGEAQEEQVLIIVIRLGLSPTCWRVPCVSSCCLVLGDWSSQKVFAAGELNFH